MASDPVRAALYERLHDDATLGGLLEEPDAVFHQGARQGATPPYVIFNFMAGTELMVFGPGSERAVWLVKGVCRGGSATPAEEIDARARVLLNRVRLETDDGTLTILRESGVRYAEDAADGSRWHHVGSLYRLFT